MTSVRRYAGYIVGQSYDAYLADMSRDGTWGDHVTLQAAADAYQVPVYLVTSFPATFW